RAKVPAGSTVGPAFSPTGRLFATGGQDGVVRVGEGATGKEVARLAGHLGAVRALAFAPDRPPPGSGAGDRTAPAGGVAALARAARRPVVPLGATRLRPLWQQVLGTNAARAYQAVLELEGSPREAVPFLKEKLAGEAWAYPRQIPKLIAALDSDRFDVR